MSLRLCRWSGDLISVVVGEPAIGLRVARGSIAMNETTPTASSHGASPRVETYPPVERAASLPVDAPPPVGPSREEPWGSAPSPADDVISDAISGFNDPDRLEPHPRGAHGHSQLQGSDVAAWAAASTVDFRSTGAPRRASTGNVEANLASHPPDGSGGFDEADLTPRLQALERLAVRVPVHQVVGAPWWPVTLKSHRYKIRRFFSSSNLQRS